MKFKCFKSLEVKPLGGQNTIEIPVGAKLSQQGDFLFYKGLPICSWRSTVAKDHLVWNGDDNADERLVYEKIILFDDRERTWTELVSYIDEDGVEKEKEQKITGRFTPDEIEYMLKNFKQFFTEDGRFNDSFYVGSNIKTVRALAKYLIDPLEQEENIL